MKSFFQHSLEEDTAWTKSASEHIFFRDVHIPLTAKMLKRALNTKKLPRVRVFHVTNSKYLDDMIKLQGKKKSISALTEAHPDIIRGGINVSGGTVFELDADVLVSAPMDIMSRPDKTGRRWLELFNLAVKGNNKENKNIKNDIEKYGIKEKKKLIFKYHPNASRRGPVPDNKVHEEWWVLNPRNKDSPLQEKIPFSVADKIPALKGKGGNPPSRKDTNIILRHMIKDYIDAMERVVAKYSKELTVLFFSHAQDALKSENIVQGWDELVVNNYKIKGVLLHKPTVVKGFSRKDEDIQKEEWEKFLQKLDSLGINYEVFEGEARDISREIATRSKLDFL